MNKSILIVGLPASGKTTYAKNHLKEYYLIDDPKDFNKDITPYLDRNVVITDPYFCDGKILKKAEAMLFDNGMIVEKIYFENNPEKALKNSLCRESKPVENFIKKGFNPNIV